MLAVALVLSLTSCSDKDNEKNTSTDTTTGATRPAEGSIVKGSIGIGTITIDGQTYTDAYGIDFNKDGILEFRIVAGGTSLQCEPANGSGDAVRGVAMVGDRIATLQKHATISSSLTYSTSLLSTLPESGSLPEKFYVAFRMDFDGIHYGWAKVKYENGELEWDKCAYCTTANAPLTAGDD